MNFFNLIATLILAGIGIAVKYLNASWLIAGYNTSSEEEKDKIDVKAMSKFVGNLMFVLAGIIFVIFLCEFLQLGISTFVMSVGWTLFVVVTFAAVIYANTGNRFIKK